MVGAAFLNTIPVIPHQIGNMPTGGVNPAIDKKSAGDKAFFSGKGFRKLRAAVTVSNIHHIIKCYGQFYNHSNLHYDPVHQVQ